MVVQISVGPADGSLHDSFAGPEATMDYLGSEHGHRDPWKHDAYQRSSEFDLDATTRRLPMVATHFQPCPGPLGWLDPAGQRIHFTAGCRG